MTSEPASEPTSEPGSALEIRTALPAEAETIAELHLRARSTYYPDGVPQAEFDWTEAWRGSIERVGGRVLCAVEEGRLAGIASFRTPDGAGADTVKLFQFHVDPDRWRGGIGTALHTACVGEWRAAGRRTAVLDVHVDNLRAQGFYARQGWVPDPENPPEEGDHHLFLRYAVPPGE
ncbi:MULTISPECIES: GNAT family N-acetyltransferase [unclassified Streptomyces]|uniref:GNAT family N-acetyltransferase n=1 Tax=unclassified Streptomyces TaxID=2593676 RepID=UPI001370DCEF|nr:GNAT family N-acetyltransferase [Streptomyces sp. SID6139]MYR01145.1 GNAT family N-acetyltransferase [Streptomyces sp. SID6139]MYR18579.1 GNAT family N-acetyltransferase [Streptomyces sp. SID6137]